MLCSNLFNAGVRRENLPGWVDWHLEWGGQTGDGVGEKRARGATT